MRKEGNRIVKRGGWEEEGEREKNTRSLRLLLLVPTHPDARRLDLKLNPVLSCYISFVPSLNGQDSSGGWRRGGGRGSSERASGGWWSGFFLSPLDAFSLFPSLFFVFLCRLPEGAACVPFCCCCRAPEFCLCFFFLFFLSGVAPLAARGALRVLFSSQRSHNGAGAPALRRDAPGNARPQRDLVAGLVGREALEGLLRRGARARVLRPAVGDEGADRRGHGLGDLAAEALGDLG